MENLSDQDSTKIFTNLARLQIEARMALSQAQSMAKMQVEVSWTQLNILKEQRNFYVVHE